LQEKLPTTRRFGTLTNSAKIGISAFSLLHHVAELSACNLRQEKIWLAKRLKMPHERTIDGGYPQDGA